MSMQAHQAMRSFRADRSITKTRLAPGTWPRIGGFARPYRRPIVTYLALIVVDAVISAGLPLVFKAVIDRGVQRHDVGLVERLALVIALLAVVQGAISLGQRWYSSRVGEGLIYDLRSATYAHVQRQSMGFFTRTQTGALISRLNSDVVGAQEAFTSTLGSILSNAVSVTLVLIAMLVLSWQVTLLSLVLLPLFIIPARLLGGRLREITRESYGLNASMSSQMTERFNVSGALLVKLFGTPEVEDRRFRERAARVRDIGVTQAIYGRVFFVALTLVASLALAITYGVGGRFAAEGDLGVGTLVALTAYLSRLYGPLTALSNVRVDMMTALVSFERVFEVLDLQPSVVDAPDAVDLPADAPASLTMEHVRYHYPAATEVSLASLETPGGSTELDDRVPEDVLRDVTITAAPGQLVALVGPSGAGKTTVSSLITRLDDPQSGRVCIGGYDLRSLRLQSLRDTVGVVTQDAHLFHDSVRVNLEHAKADATEEQMWAALDAAHVGDLVRSLPDQLDTVVGERGHRLSGGEKQRLAIARVLLKAPRIVVLDEATAHLDSESELAVQRALDSALAGRTALVIAHRLSTVRGADVIIVLDHGRVVQTGTHTELLERGGLYADLYTTQFAPQEQPAAA